MSDLPDRVAMGFAEVVELCLDNPDIATPPATMLGRQDWLKAIAAALSSHGLREMVEALEWYGNGDFHDDTEAKKALAALGEPPTVKGGT